MELRTASHFPGYKSGLAAVQRASRLRTFDTCQSPPRAVRTPRQFNAIAIPLRLVTPDFFSDAMIGSTVSAKLSAERI